MNFGSLFAGIGGIDLGLERAGMTCKWQVEIDDFCQKVLEKHWPKVERFKDVRTVGKHNLKTVDLIAGGFPCQDVSLAGKRKGLEGERSTLWSEFYRIVCEIRPEWVVIENVPGLLTVNNGEFFRKILWELSQSGYDAEWDFIPARAIGAPHRRDRIFIVAYSKRFRRKKVDFVIQRIALKRSNTETWNKRRLDKPNIERVVDGLSGQLDRLKSLGNAVVPQVAEYIGRCIMEIEELAGKEDTG
jgi:DNA (cytosine-5)-methyltransferase 1